MVKNGLKKFKMKVIFWQAAKKFVFYQKSKIQQLYLVEGKGGEGGGKKKLNPFREIAKNNVTKKWLFYEGLNNDCHVFL